MEIDVTLEQQHIVCNKTVPNASACKLKQGKLYSIILKFNLHHARTHIHTHA